MFDTTNFEKISDHSYIWRGFLNDEIVNEAFKESEFLSVNLQSEVRPYDKIELLGAPMNKKVVDKVSDLFKDLNWEIKYFLHWHTPANTWFGIHRDNEADDETPFEKVWSGVIYLSDMDGGILFYPEENLTVQPGKGDLVIHHVSCPHGATPVSGNNKRTITFTLYDNDKPVAPTNTSGMDNTCIEISSTAAEESAKTHNKIFTLTDWLNTDIGKAWRKAFNIRDEQLTLN
jgi:hypothetical protein